MDLYESRSTRRFSESRVKSEPVSWRRENWIPVTLGVAFPASETEKHVLLTCHGCFPEKAARIAGSRAPPHFVKPIYSIII